MNAKYWIWGIVTAMIGIAACATSDNKCINKFTYLNPRDTLHYTITRNTVYRDTAIDILFSGDSVGTIVATQYSTLGSFNGSVYYQPCGDTLFTTFSRPDTTYFHHYSRIYAPALHSSWTEIYSTHTSYRYTVLDKNVIDTVTAGVFTCDKYSVQQVGSSTVDTIFYNPQVGEVEYRGAALCYHLSWSSFK